MIQAPPPSVKVDTLKFYWILKTQKLPFESLTNLGIIKSSIYIIKIHIFIFNEFDWNITLPKPLIIPDLFNGNTLHSERERRIKKQ